MSKLDTLLAARKAQMTTATSTHLVGLRGGDDADSDDDDDDTTTSSTVAITNASSNNDLLLSRAENLLRSPKVEERKKTLAQLEEANLTADQLKPLLRPLLLRFSDDAERCRDTAINLFRRWQSASGDPSEVSGALPFLMPVMVERLGSESTHEPSEEVRASLVMLMRDVLLCARKLIRPYIAEVGSIALGCARDNHPEVIKGLCELMAAVSHDVLQPLVKELDKKQVKPFSTKLIEALLPHITHRHGAVRLQVLGALEELLLCGAGQSVETLTGWRLKNNVPVAEFYGKGAPRVNYLADLSRDRSVAVRRKFVQVVSRWCYEMDGEDLYEQEVRIIPYLINGLTDEDEETQKAAVREIERLGEQHIEKNIKDYKERIEYGHADEQAATRAMSIPPPNPLPCRPSLGARERVKQHFRALIHPICAELEAWTGKERLQSSRLLEVLLAYSEGSVTEFVHQLLPALAKGMDEECKGLPEVIERCAMQLAQHIHPDEYIPLLCGRAGSDPLNPLSQRMQHLQLIPHLLKGTKPKERIFSLRGLRKLFADYPIVCTQHTPLRKAFRDALSGAIDAAASIGTGTGREGTGWIALTKSPNAKAPFTDALVPSLLLSVAVHLASSDQLQPKVTSLGDGLEDISDADESVWSAAAEDAIMMAAPMAVADGDKKEGGGGGAGVWGMWKLEVMKAIDQLSAGDDEYAPLARKLVTTILEKVGGSVPVMAQQKIVEPSTAKKVVVIEEGDFSDEEEEEESGSAAKKDDLDEYEEAELD